MTHRNLADVLARDAGPTLEAIERDERRAPPAIRPLFASIRELLFDSDADLDRIRVAARLGDESVWKLFRDIVEKSAWSYTAVLQTPSSSGARPAKASRSQVRTCGWCGRHST